jgi:hypothetical protein
MGARDRPQTTKSTDNRIVPIAPLFKMKSTLPDVGLLKHELQQENKELKKKTVFMSQDQNQL